MTKYVVARIDYQYNDQSFDCYGGVDKLIRVFDTREEAERMKREMDVADARTLDDLELFAYDGDYPFGSDDYKDIGKWSDRQVLDFLERHHLEFYTVLPVEA